MTAKEIIIKAWMDLNIETPVAICYKNGWLHGYFCNGIDDITEAYGDIAEKIDFEIDFDGVGTFRPKSLRGIENNNGWIKVETEADLPTIGTYYTLLTFNNSIEEREFPNHEFSLEFNKKWWLKYVTHYQPIIKPDLPLY